MPFVINIIEYQKLVTHNLYCLIKVVIILQMIQW